MNVLTLNAGSNSLKFEIVSTEPSNTSPSEPVGFGRSLVSGAYDNIGKEDSAFTLLKDKQTRHKQEMWNARLAILRSWLH
jgi:acetate kinase